MSMTPECDVSDGEIVVLGIVMSCVVAVALWYLAEDEIERQWHARELKRLKGKR